MENGFVNSAATFADEQGDDVVINVVDPSPPTGQQEGLARFKITKSPTEESLHTSSSGHDNCTKGEEHDKFEDNQLSVRHVQFPADANENTTSHRNTQTAHATLGYMTHDAVPLSVFYRDQSSLDKTLGETRPTLDQLHKGQGLENAKKRHWDGVKEEEDNAIAIADLEKNVKTATKFGWIKGVLFPTLLNIWGVILFLRMPWIVGQAGIILSSVIVLLATFVTVVTCLSMSAVCTNGEVKGGGAYYLISRSLGPEFGGSIGVIFSLANAVAVALYLIGFGETIQALLGRYDLMMVSVENDVRIIALLALVLIFVVTIVGLDWVIHTQSFLLLMLIVAIASVVIGTIYPMPSADRATIKAKGLPGYEFELFKDNLLPNYTDGYSFFTVFSIFFPAATGIMAGANLSGDLKEPSKAVPLGTLLAIGITSFSYVVLCWLLGASTMRGATGVIGAADNITLAEMLTNTTIGQFSDFGANYDLQIMEKISLWGPLVLIGIIAATLSSALASLVSAPKVFQAVCKDKIFPHIEVFGKGFGRNQEPRYGYLLTLAIAAAFVGVGKLNLIAPIISNFFLMAYALINYSVFMSSISKSPGWRPSFKYYNMWVSLAGFLLCIAIMFLINWWAALITIVVVAALYLAVDIRKPDINWGSSGGAHTFVRALRLTRRLETVEEHVKNFRVQVLCLTGQPSLRPNLVHFVSHITKTFGLMVCGEVAISPNLTKPSGHEGSWLKKHKVKAFHQIVQSETLGAGARCMLQTVGLGKLKPNTLIMGYMAKWQHADQEKIDEYFHIVHDAFDLSYGVGILRLQDGFDITEVVDDEINDGVVENREPDWYTEDWDESQQPHNSDGSDQAREEEATPGKPMDIVNAFDKKRKGYIDVWWLYDDGGLTILIPHLLSLSAHWRGCKLRIFTPASDKKIKANQIRMANLLKKFRIDFSSVVEFRGINKHPKDESVNAFKRLRHGGHLSLDGQLDKKTLRQIRLGELLHEHSKEAKLIVLTLPIPKRSVVTSLMYMAWLEVLTADLPPTLLIRGNQQSVLTFYS